MEISRPSARVKAVRSRPPSRRRRLGCLNSPQSGCTRRCSACSHARGDRLVYGGRVSEPRSSSHSRDVNRGALFLTSAALDVDHMASSIALVRRSRRDRGPPAIVTPRWTFTTVRPDRLREGGALRDPLKDTTRRAPPRRARQPRVGECPLMRHICRRTMRHPPRYIVTRPECGIDHHVPPASSSSHESARAIWECGTGRIRCGACGSEDPSTRTATRPPTLPASRCPSRAARRRQEAKRGSSSAARKPMRARAPTQYGAPARER